MTAKEYVRSWFESYVAIIIAPGAKGSLQYKMSREQGLIPYEKSRPAQQKRLPEKQRKILKHRDIKTKRGGAHF